MACVLRSGVIEYFAENKRRLSFMKLGIVESEPVSISLRKRTNADKA